jgi:hypothetical protein
MTTEPISAGADLKAALLDVLQQSEEPRTAADLRKLLPGDKKPTAAKLKPALEQLIASGAACRFAPISGKADRYWVPGRDPDLALKKLLLAAVQRADAPRTTKQLLADLPSGKKPPVAKIEQLVEAFVAAGELHQFAPAKGKNKAARYWDRDRDEYVRGVIVATLAKGKGTARAPMTFADLRKAVKSQLEEVSEDALSQFLQDLLDNRRVHKGLNFDKKHDKQPYSTRPPNLRHHLAQEFITLYKKYENAGVPRDQVDAAALAYLGGSQSAQPAQVSRERPQDLERVIMEVFEQLRREKFGHTRLVPIHAIRSVIKERFGDQAARHDTLDETIKRLWRGGRLNLLPINDATGVSVEEMNDSIPGTAETWFYLEAK